MNNLSLLPIDILIIIFSKLTPIEAYNFGWTCKQIKLIYNHLDRHTKYKSINFELLKNEIKLGNRYLKINQEIHKIINLISYFKTTYNIILKEGLILNVGENRINLFNYKKFNKMILEKDIKLITESKFIQKINPINSSDYNVINCWELA